MAGKLIAMTDSLCDQESLQKYGEKKELKQMRVVV